MDVPKIPPKEPEFPKCDEIRDGFEKKDILQIVILIISVFLVGWGIWFIFG